MVASVLSIAGSDSGGGAGIQADLRTFAAHGVHGLTAIAALTAQNTRGVTAVHVPPSDFLAEQIDACFADFDIRAVKLGMLADAATVHEVANALERQPPVPVVLDPVMVATSGARLLADDALHALRDRLVPLAAVVTPNAPEAEVLTGWRIVDDASALIAGQALLASGARSVLVKGGHVGDPAAVVDQLLLPGGAVERFVHPRLPLAGHGTGCTLASAIAAHLALGRSLAAACSLATDYVHRALLTGYRPGRSELVVLDHFGASR